MGSTSLSVGGGAADGSRCTHQTTKLRIKFAGEQYTAGRGAFKSHNMLKAYRSQRCLDRDDRWAAWTSVHSLAMGSTGSKKRQKAPLMRSMRACSRSPRSPCETILGMMPRFLVNHFHSPLHCAAFQLEKAPLPQTFT